MTEDVILQSRELEAVAEEAGGYVATPGSLPANPQGEREFTAMRQYSIKCGKPMSKFTDADYKKLGIVRR